jgi:hypothetical protein
LGGSADLKQLPSENCRQLTHNSPPQRVRAVSFDKGKDFVNIIGNKYSGKSHEFLTILMPKIECQLNALLIFHLLNP